MDMIAFENYRAHGRKCEAEGRFFHYNLLLLSFPDLFKTDVWLNSLDNAVAVVREAIGDNPPDPSTGGSFLLNPSIAGDAEGSWVFWDMPSRLSHGNEERHIVLSNIQV